MKLNVKAFALTAGLWWGSGLLLLTWWAIAFGAASGDAAFLGRLYIGYTVSPAGSVLGLAWGFVDGLIGGAIFAWLYNLLASRLFSNAGA
ncbi:MAG: bacteriophage holin [Rhodospirillales bacterium]|jgi:hypothetical protein|nr:bacteriophage holin [Rhodospirillales bacterium]